MYSFFIKYVISALLLNVGSGLWGLRKQKPTTFLSDNIVKPFHFDELLSRIRALTRRNHYLQSDPTENILDFGSLKIDRNQYQVQIDAQDVILSPRELKLLNYLVENKDKTVTRIQILNAVWGITFDNHTNVVDVYISYLRNKIEKSRKYIFTIKVIGYVFKS